MAKEIATWKRTDDAIRFSAAAALEQFSVIRWPCAVIDTYGQLKGGSGHAE